MQLLTDLLECLGISRHQVCDFSCGEPLPASLCQAERLAKHSRNQSRPRTHANAHHVLKVLSFTKNTEQDSDEDRRCIVSIFKYLNPKSNNSKT